MLKTTHKSAGLKYIVVPDQQANKHSSTKKFAVMEQFGTVDSNVCLQSIESIFDSWHNGDACLRKFVTYFEYLLLRNSNLAHVDRRIEFR